jgi:hypothetical protein
MRTLLCSTFLALAASPAATFEGWKDLTGEPAPPIEADAWIHAQPDEATIDALRGKVYLLEFFATW